MYTDLLTVILAIFLKILVSNFDLYEYPMFVLTLISGSIETTVYQMYKNLNLNTGVMVADNFVSDHQTLLFSFGSDVDQSYENERNAKHVYK